MTTKDTIEIRPVSSFPELHQVEDLQRTVWGFPEDELLPAHILHALEFNGALLLGAFAGDKMVGFVFGVLGTVQSPDRIDQVAAARLKMYSVVTGVDPGYQDHQIGWRLKLAQREEALRQGIRLITWTYDPLESRNGWLNIGKLGTVCNRYLPHFYGEMTGINAGLASDRFYVEWWVTSNRAKGRVTQKRKPLQFHSLIGGGAVLLNEATFNHAGLPVPPTRPILKTESNLLLVEIPADIQTIKREDMPLAQAWRAHTAAIFPDLFAAGYLVTDFARQIDEAGRDRSYYLLSYQHS